MASTITALLAVAIHEARSAEIDPTGLVRVSTLLVTAAGARKFSFEVDHDQLLINDQPQASEAPGASMVRHALVLHDTRKLVLPGGLTANQWRDLALFYASAPGIHPTSEHKRAAVLSIVPGAQFLSVTGSERDANHSMHAAASLTHLVSGDTGSDPALTSSDVDRSDLSRMLAPSVNHGRTALERGDWPVVFDVLLQLGELERRSVPAVASMVMRERRRLISGSVLDTIVQMLPGASRTSAVRRAFLTLDGDGANALLDALAERPSRADRRDYMELLAELPGAESALVSALDDPRNQVVVDAAEALGRRRNETAVTPLARLLHHSSEDVRTSTWHALEQIGTVAALEALRGGRRF